MLAFSQTDTWISYSFILGSLLLVVNVFIIKINADELTALLTARLVANGIVRFMVLII